MKIKTKTVHSVDYQDFEICVEEHYGKEISVPAALQCGNDVSQEFKVTAGNDKWGKATLAAWLDGEEDWGVVDAILNDLAGKDIIPTGDYVMRISW